MASSRRSRCGCTLATRPSSGGSSIAFQQAGFTARTTTAGGRTTNGWLVGPWWCVPFSPHARESAPPSTVTPPSGLPLCANATGHISGACRPIWMSDVVEAGLARLVDRHGLAAEATEQLGRLVHLVAND